MSIGKSILCWLFWNTEAIETRHYQVQVSYYYLVKALLAGPRWLLAAPSWSSACPSWSLVG